LGFTPGLLWLAFFLKEDVHPEPRKMIARVFIIGALSAFAALFVELILNNPLKGISISIPGIIYDNLSTFIFFAIIEEVIKFYFVWKIIHKSPYFDEPIDAMIYMVTGALGFATAENFFLVISSRDGIFTVILMRFIGATLLHALSSAVVGYMWAWGIKRRKMSLYLGWGLILASLTHAAFNILVFKFNSFLVYPTIFLAVVGFIVLYDFEKLRDMGEIKTNSH
jgi:RsiW-degrading membrane proteinase PrsW (M82 family)